MLVRALCRQPRERTGETIGPESVTFFEGVEMSRLVESEVRHYTHGESCIGGYDRSSLSVGHAPAAKN